MKTKLLSVASEEKEGLNIDLLKPVDKLNPAMEKTWRKQGNTLSAQETNALKELQKLNLPTVFNGMTKKTVFDKRIENIDSIINKNHITPYNNEYFSGLRQLPKALNKFTKKFFKEDLIRGDKWRKTTIPELEKNINSTANAGKTIEKLKEINKTLKNAESKEIGKVNNIVEVILKKFGKAKRAETENYAGRVLDMNLGGGIPEILIPPVVGGI